LLAFWYSPSWFCWDEVLHQAPSEGNATLPNYRIDQRLLGRGH
jgi:hypothetical protein